MRKAPSKEEIEKAEKAKEDRLKIRNQGLSMRKIRDRGWAKLKNYKGGEILMLYGPEVSLDMDNKGLFKLVFKDSAGKKTELVLQADEINRWLRWV